MSRGATGPRARVARGARSLAALGAVLCSTVLATAPSGATPGVVAQDRNTGVLDITSVTPWVAPDGEFQVRFAPTTQVPAGAELTYTIHQALTPTPNASLRSQVEAVLAGAPPGRILQRQITRPLAEYGDPAAGSALTIPVRAQSGDAARALLPNPGIHPVELVLTDPTGELWRQVVFLNRLPVGAAGAEDPASTTGSTTTTTTSPRQRPATPPPVAVTLLVPIETPPTLDPTGTPSFDLAQRTTLDAAASLLGSTPDAPLSIAVRPNTLDGLARTAERWSDRLIGALRAAVDATGSSGDGGSSRLVGLPYVHVDTGGLVAADADDDVERQRALGQQVTSEVVGARGDGDSWVMDDSLTPESLPLLASLDVEGVVVPTSMLELGGDVSEERAVTGPLALDGGDGVRAIAYDGLLSQRLADTSIEPGVRSHAVVSLLMASWFGAQRDARPTAAVIVVPPTIDATVVNSLAASLDGSGPLLADTSAPILPEAAGDEPRVELLARPVPNERGAVADSDETRRQIAAYQSMVGSMNPTASLWERLNAETLATGLDGAGRAALRDTIRGQIAGELAKIEPPPERQVLLTGRDTTIPLRMRNDLPFAVQLRLRASSPRLEVEGGESRIITLQPGENRFDLPVSVQAPGESLLRIELSTPDDGIQLASLDLPVRSTAISGVGAALSVISVLFLVAWWVHTHRRKRREEARANGTHPAGAAATTATERTEPEPTPSTGADDAVTDSATAPATTDSVTEGG